MQDDKEKRKSHVRSTTKYAKNNTKSYTLQLNMDTDKDLIEVLDSQENKQGFIKMLIWRYISFMMLT